MLPVKFGLLSAACAVSIEITGQLQSDPEVWNVDDIDWGSDIEIPDDLLEDAEATTAVIEGHEEITTVGDWADDIDWDSLEEEQPPKESDYETESSEAESNAITSVAIAMTSLVLSSIMLA